MTKFRINIDKVYKTILLLVTVFLLVQGYSRSKKYAKITYEQSLLEIYYGHLIEKHLLSCANFKEEAFFSAVKSIDSTIIFNNGSNLSGPILVFRIPEGACQTCIRHDFESFFNMVDSLNIKDFHIIGNFDNYFKFQSFSREVKYNFKIGTLERGEYFASSDVSGLPYFCVLYNHTISHIFFPDRIIPNLTISYLEHVIEFINN